MILLVRSTEMSVSDAARGLSIVAMSRSQWESAHSAEPRPPYRRSHGGRSMLFDVSK